MEKKEERGKKEDQENEKETRLGSDSCSLALFAQ